MPPDVHAGGAAAPSPSPAEREAAVRLQLAELAPRQREALVAAAGSLDALAGMTEADLVARGARVDAARALTEAGPSRLERELAAASRLGVTILVRGDAAYPSRLRDLPDAPHALWLRGRLPPEPHVTVAVVGSRRPSAYGLAVVRRLVRDLADLGCVVVSGGARGIDGLAHATALERGAWTAAVLGSGVDVAYPSQHRDLFARLAREGALLSELPLGTSPARHYFPARNRILSGLSRAVVVVEASCRSGSLITARLGLEQGRDVLAVPGSVLSPLSEGTNSLIGRGAKVCSSALDVLEELRPDELAMLPGLARAGTGASPAREEREALPTAEAPKDQRLLARVGRGEAHSLETLSEALQVPVPALLALLSEWEAAGKIRRLPGGSWLRD